MKQYSEHISLVLGSVPGCHVLVMPDAPVFTIIAVSDDYLGVTGRRREELVARGLFDVFPNNPEDQNLTSENRVRDSLIYALRNKEANALPVHRYDLPNEEGIYTERYWLTCNKPVLDESGKVIYLIHIVEDITLKVKAERREKEIRSIEKTYGLFMQAPTTIALVKGPQYILELVNEGALKLWGKTDEIIGKPLLEAIPEVKEQGITERLDLVLSTGKPFIAKEMPVTTSVNGEKEQHYFDLVYQPYYEDGNKKPAGVFTLSHDVTELVMAKNEIQEREEKYRSFFESMDQGFCVLEMLFDPDNTPIDYRFLEINPVFEQQTGLVNAVGKTIRELVPGIEKHWIALYGEVALTGQPLRFIEESKAMNRWFEAQAFRVGGPESRKVGLFFKDITAQKKMQQALTESEANLRNMIIHAPVAMCILRGPSFVVEIANQKMFETWQRNPEMMLGKPVFEGLTEAYDHELDKLLENVYRTGKAYSDSERPIKLPRDGRVETAYINFVFEPLKSGEGTINGIIVVAIDVTDLVVARMKVEEANKELQFVMNFMPQMVWSTLPDGTADFFSQVYLNYTGLSMDRLTGFQWADLIHPNDLANSIKAWDIALAGKNDEYVVEHRLKGKDSSYRWFLTRGVPLKDENGKMLKWYGTTTDIQEQKNVAELLELRVEERTKELEIRNRELEQFTYVSHHDLQEPLRKIIMFTDMVRADSYDALTEASQKRLDRVIDSARRMSAALKDVLNYASLNKEEQFVEIDLDETLAAVQMDLELVISEKGAKIHSDALPTIKAIPGQMHQLFYNLVNNALKFTKPGFPPVLNISCKVIDQLQLSQHAELQQGKLYYQITVQDNGIGFDQEFAEKIFVMFQRLHSKDTYAGTGIGLALCRKVVLNHGGKIWAKSSEGEGAIFKILLPFSK